MTAQPRIPLPHLFSGKERVLKLALCLAFVLHALILIPFPQFRSRPLLDPSNLVEVNLVAPKSITQHHTKPSPPPAKPKLKRKIKTKIKKKPATLKKPKTVVKKSALARRPSVPKKKAAPTNNKLNEIKKRLSRQRDEQKLNNIRQRLRQESSPAARALQASLTQVYNNQLKTWLMRNWHLPEHLLNSGLVATVSLTIDASGELIQQSEEKLSGNFTFDHALRQAIINATPFPPFPAELNIPQEEFVITFDPNNLKSHR
ncbi:MAG: TonB C-terminal domain-containing protein [Deltaproteobacteria bacterium]|nr:TonB C-terminal domain-containing protein [Candidatus Tharpella sp.]